ncbi:MAG: carboxypeptidase regulatory-like domain-containing protein [Elusimicrobia bacterium]|nr:carboxypeptidase regulatory-like domain-containing protein [Candidatus Liberimonas magnetica]
MALVSSVYGGYTITTIAGNIWGYSGYSGDGGNAALAQLNAPWGIGVDASGNVYIADTYNNRIRKVTPSGKITTIAGTGTTGYSGDGGSALDAQLNAPWGIGVDASGNVFFASFFYDRIRKITVSGIISSFAGTGTAGYAGDGAGAASAQLNVPCGVAVDVSGNVYIADSGNQRIRKIDTSGIITTIAGTGSAGYSGDGGSATSAQLNGPRGVAVDVSGNVYFTDYANQRVRKINTFGIITTIAGTGSAGYSGDGGRAVLAQLNAPEGIGVDASANVYIADYGNHRIRKVTAGGIIMTIAGTGTAGYSGDGGNAALAQLNSPRGVAVDASGNVYVADNGNHRIRKVFIKQTGFVSGKVTKQDGVTAVSGALIEAVRSGVVKSSATSNASGNYSIKVETGTCDVRASLSVFQTQTKDGYTVANGSTITVNFSLVQKGIVSGRVTKSGGGAAISGALIELIQSKATKSTFLTDRSGNYLIRVGTGTYDIKASLIGYKPQTKTAYYVKNGSTVTINLSLTEIASAQAGMFSYTITTIAGTGAAGYAGDGGSAVFAQLNVPCGIAVDGLGNLYIADYGNHRIRKVNALGIITTIAGNGTAGFSGDGGSALLAQLNSPRGVAVDDSGNVYIADYDNQRIRKVTVSGIISTIAGNGTAGFSGDGESAILAKFNGPRGVAVDVSGNVYVADYGNNRIRKINSSGIITTITGIGTTGYAGDGGSAASAQLNGPRGVAVDAAGNVYIADNDNHGIRKVSILGIITTIAGTGVSGYAGDGESANLAQIDSPYGVAVDVLGNVYIADLINNVIRKVSTLGIITTIAGTGTWGYSGDGGPATAAQLDSPFGVAVDASGNIYIADNGNHRIRKVNASGIITTISGTGTAGFSGDGGSATSAQLASPRGVAVDISGNVYIADSGNQRIRKINASGIITTIAGTGTADYSRDGVIAILAQLNSPSGAAVDASGNVYIADYGNHRIRKVNTSGIISTIAGTGTAGYAGDGGSAVFAKLNGPSGVTVDSSGNLYIADNGNHRIRKVNTSGIISTIAGTGAAGYSGDGGSAVLARLRNPCGIAVDISGNVYISDDLSCRIRKITASGIILTIAGTGAAGYAGDGGSAALARFGAPFGIAVDASGNVYIADYDNHRIRKASLRKQ